MVELMRSGEWLAAWVSGGLFVGGNDASVLFDAPDGAGRALSGVGLDPDVVAFSGGRLPSVCGFNGVIAAAVARGRTRPLRVWSVLGEERASRLVDAASAWALPFDLVVDAEPPGACITAGSLQIDVVALRRGEVDGSMIVGVPAVGFRVRGPVDVAYVPGCGPGARALCEGAALAVVEVGVAPWPAHPERWRFSVDEAISAARRARQVVLVGDDGSLVPSISA